MTLRFSANLGFLWADRPLPDAIHAAKFAGFDAVECHWPYDTPSEDVNTALRETGLPMLGLNTSRGDTAAGENGLSALPGRETDARSAIDQALAYGAQIGAAKLHVMAGFAAGPDAAQTFTANLKYALTQAKPLGIDLLIEPLNRHDAPGYFLQTTDQARQIIEDIGDPHLQLMFDCYHIGRTEGDITWRLESLWPLIGHVQIASVPDRAAPDHGELDYAHIYAALTRLGYSGAVGAEYKPGGPTDDTLGWLKALQA